MKETFIVGERFTLGEYLSANFFVTARLKLVKKIMLIGFVIGAFSAITDLAASAHHTPGITTTIFKFLMLPTFFLLFIVVAITLFSVLIFKFKPGIFRGVSYTFNHWGVDKTGETFHFSAPWSQLKGFKESKQFFFLYNTDTTAFMVQKRMFHNPDEVAAFRIFIAEKIPALR